MSDRYKSFLAQADEPVAAALRAPNGRKAFDELDAEWLYLLERGRQDLLRGRDQIPMADVTTVLNEWPADKTSMIPGQVARLGGLLVRLLYNPELLLDDVTPENLIPYDAFAFQLFADGQGRPVRAADLPEWVFEGSMPATFDTYGDTPAVRRGTFTLRLKYLDPVRRYLKRHDLLSAMRSDDRSRYLNKLRGFGFEEIGSPSVIGEPQAKMMLRYPTYDEFEADYDTWGPKFKDADKLLYAYRSAFRERAPAGVIRTARDGSIMYVVAGPAPAARLKEIAAARDAAEAASRASAEATRAQSTRIMAENFLPPEVRKLYPLRFLPDTTLSVLANGQLMVDVEWPDRPGLEPRAPEKYTVSIPNSLGLPTGETHEEHAAWVNWEPTLRLLAAIASLRTPAGDSPGALVREAAVMALFLPADNALQAERMNAVGDQEGIFLGWRYALNGWSTRPNRGPLWGVYRMADLRTLTPDAASTILSLQASVEALPREPIQYGAATPIEALAQWIKNYPQLARDATALGDESLWNAAQQGVTEGLTQQAAQQAELRRDGGHGWKQFEEAKPLPGILLRTPKGEAQARKSFETAIRRLDKEAKLRDVRMGGETWVVPYVPQPGEKKQQRKHDPMPAPDGSLPGSTVLALRTSDPAKNLPVFDAMGDKKGGKRCVADFLRQFADPMECIPTTATFGATTMDWLPLLAQFTTAVAPNLAGINPWLGFTFLSEEHPTVKIPDGVVFASDGRRLHAGVLNTRPPAHVALPFKAILEHGGPVWAPVGGLTTAESGFTPYFAWDGGSQPDWAAIVPNRGPRGRISEGTIKAWATMKPPHKKGATFESGGKTFTAFGGGHSSRPLTFEYGKETITVPWNIRTEARADGLYETVSTTLPGIDWVDGHPASPTYLSGAYLQGMAQAFAQIKAPVWVLMSGGLQPVLFYQLLPLGPHGTQLVLTQFHVVMPMRGD